MTRVLILGGGPDSERDISIASATGVHRACLDAGLDSTLKIIDRPTISEIKAWDTDVVFPVVHGEFGEGGSLQTRLDRARKLYIGSGFRASKLAMDKMGTKLIAAGLSIKTPTACILDANGVVNSGPILCPLDFPVVIKPVADGSSVGLYICPDESSFHEAIDRVRDDLIAHPYRVYMIEQMVQGRELTVSVLGNEQAELEALPLIEISPADGVYDFEAKYARNDTVYTPNPDLADGIAAGMKENALRLCKALGVKHLGRVDFILQPDGQWNLLEVNTMPGFTATSLMPMAAQAIGMEMPDLCAHLVKCALSEHPSVCKSE